MGRAIARAAVPGVTLAFVRFGQHFFNQLHYITCMCYEVEHSQQLIKRILVHLCSMSLNLNIKPGRGGGGGVVLLSIALI